MSRESPKVLTRRHFLAGGVVAGLGLASYASTWGRDHAVVTENRFLLAGLPDAFVEFRLVQISDFHLMEFTEPWFLEQVVEQVNALKPELVLLTGDFVSFGPRPFSYAWEAAGTCAEILSKLKAPQRFAVLGNHDSGVGAQHVVDPLQAHGTPFLVNRYVAIERGDSRIWLGGTSDYSSYGIDLNLAVPNTADGPVLLMCHEPDYADEVAKHPRFFNIALMISGHTHGGQVRIPGMRALRLPLYGREYVEGRFQIGHMHLFVNRGIGTVDVPFRLNCPPEISVITLGRA